jgi:hypothetical protein
MELVACRMHDRTGDDLGLVELPVGWELAPGDMLGSEDGRIEGAVELVLCTSPSSRADRAAVG